MKRLLAAVLLAATAFSCASSAPAEPFSGKWAVKVTRRNGEVVGRLVFELTTLPASSCVGVPDMVSARILESEGFEDDYVRTEAAVFADAKGQIYADLSVGACDHNLVLIGRFRGRRAWGKASRSTLVGSRDVGRFEAEKL